MHFHITPDLLIAVSRIHNKHDRDIIVSAILELMEEVKILEQPAGSGQSDVNFPDQCSQL